MKKIIAGVDEVGRGSLVGPVYAAAIVLNKNINKKKLKDSKKLSKKNREILEKLFRQHIVYRLKCFAVVFSNAKFFYSR